MILQFTTEPTNTDSFWTIIASIAAVLSAIYSFRSNHIANKSLKLAEREYKNKEANFSLYLIDGFRWSQSENEKRKVLFFHATINNKSDNKSSYKGNLSYLNIDIFTFFRLLEM